MISPAAEKTLQDAIAQHRQGNLAAALERYMKVLAEDPRHPDALYYVSVVVFQDGQPDQALELTERALSLDPPPGRPQARLHDLLGRILASRGDGACALAAYDRAIAADRSFADAHGNRALLLSDLGDLNGAMAAFDNALTLRPDSFEDWCNRGAVLQWLGRAEEALRSFERAVALKPDFAGGHLNRGQALRELGQIAASAGGAPDMLFDQAEAALGKALELEPGFADAHTARALLRLVRGHWGDGFRDRARGAPAPAPTKHPRWTGGPLPVGQRLVLVAGPGLGDTVAFARFAPLLAARGFAVTLLVRPDLKSLLATLPGPVAFATSWDEIERDSAPLHWTPAMDAAGLLGLSPDSVPAQTPWLAAEPQRVAHWRRHFGETGFKVGINWAAGPSPDRNLQRRNLPLSAFAPLAALDGARLVSLQKGPAVAEIARAPFRERIETPPHDPDWNPDNGLDLAAILSTLDLVVTCDTFVAHLAGALGRPVLLALPAVADWRWLAGREDTPWYPSMRLMRQRRPGDWSDPMARIAADVRERIGATS